MSQFRKKPVVIDAVQFDGTPGGAVIVFALFKIPGGKFRPGNSLEIGTLLIPTLEGDHTASPGDWIIKGVKGEFYPVKPDIFSATYEAVDAIGTNPDASPITPDPLAAKLAEVCDLLARCASGDPPLPCNCGLAAAIGIGLDRVTETPDADEAKLGMVTEYEKTGTLDIAEWVERYPEHREELLDFWLFLRGTPRLTVTDLDPLASEGTLTRAVLARFPEPA